MNDRRQYNGIDVVKFIMALLVIVLHTRPLIHINAWLEFLTADVLGRIAVPFFFTATGFLLEKQLEPDTVRIAEGECSKRDYWRKLQSYIIKILKLYCLWTIAYLPFIVYNHLVVDGDSYLRAFLLFARDFFFVGPIAHLWYMTATVIGVLLVWILRNYLGEKKTTALLLLLFVIGVITQSYFSVWIDMLGTDSFISRALLLARKAIVTCRNGVFFGAPCIYLGTWIARHEKVEREKWKKSTLVGFILSLSLLAVEEGLLRKSGFEEKDMYLMLIPVSFFLMQIALQLRTAHQTQFLRQMSSNIFFVHMIFKYIYQMFIEKGTRTGMPAFAFTLVGSLLTAYLLYRLQVYKETRS